ncbi:MAG: hypothetical protein RMY28_032745 [Nostoc sp. ChiSLP01]|nr:hypothetical protein [Nostoc sp. CmiSLP01]MDZ8284193.1 hypothetical protein [Nostoc sp. ChiSLP01]
MIIEQLLLEKWRSLPPEKQQEVFDFVEFLESRQERIYAHPVELKPKSQLGAKLDKIRESIVGSGIPLLTDEEIDREVIERRGGYQESK